MISLAHYWSTLRQPIKRTSVRCNQWKKTTRIPEYASSTANTKLLICCWHATDDSCAHAKMNFTSRLSLENDSSSEETDGWSFTGSTASPRTSGSSSDVDWFTYLAVSVQWVIFFVGTFGNIAVLVVLLWRRSPSQVGTQFFVGSLAVADIGLMLSTVWVEAYDALQKGWQFGVIPCKLQYLWQWSTMNCSIWTLAALSIDRYLRALIYFFQLVATVCTLCIKKVSAEDYLNWFTAGKVITKIKRRTFYWDTVY